METAAVAPAAAAAVATAAVVTAAAVTCDDSNIDGVGGSNDSYSNSGKGGGYGDDDNSGGNRGLRQQTGKFWKAGGIPKGVLGII